MTDHVDQVELRWSTPQGRLNPHSFRNAVGFALGAAARDMDWGWLFNDAASQPGPGAIAPVRFFTGANREGAFAAIVAVGPDACGKLAAAMTAILPAARVALATTGHPSVRYDKVWWKPADANQFRITTLVLNRIKGDKAHYDALRADPERIHPFVSEAIATGLDRMAARVDLPLPGIDPTDVKVVSLGDLSAQPVGSAGRGMRTRLTHAVVSMPIRLQGDWRVGGLIGYGNGHVAETVKERHWRDSDAAAVPHPRYPRMAA